MADPSRYAVVHGGVVANVILARSAPEDGVLLGDEAVSPGDLWDGTTFTRPDPPELSPDPIREGVQAARDAVAGMSPTSGTRRAVEALCDALDPPPPEEP